MLLNMMNIKGSVCCGLVWKREKNICTCRHGFGSRNSRHCFVAKKDWVKCVAKLHKNPAGWVLMNDEPEMYITRATEAGKDGLFAYLSTSRWHLADQIADGFFWINENEEILLLRQKKVMKDYWQWTASRPFFEEKQQRLQQDIDAIEKELNHQEIKSEK